VCVRERDRERERDDTMESSKIAKPAASRALSVVALQRIRGTGGGRARINEGSEGWVGGRGDQGAMERGFNV